MDIALPKHIPQPNNFNMLRLMLAFYVFLAHFFYLLGPITEDVNIVYVSDSVRGFFVISGFLIYSSYCRAKSLKSYFIKRARRILPSYILIISFFAVALVFVSSLSVEEYFGAHWFKYFASNMAFSNFMEPTLPGVFSDNYLDVVNGSLWTIKIEIMCYVALPVLIYICKKSRINPLIFFGVIILLSMVYTFTLDTLHNQSGDERYAIYARQIGGQLAYFVSGMIFYELLPYIVKYKYKLLVLGVACMAIGYAVPQAASFIKPVAIALVLIPGAFVGRWGSWLGSTDISYDMYLLHFPVIQLFVHFGVADNIGVVPTLAVCTATVILLSSLSWHYVGRRFLQRSQQ